MKNTLLVTGAAKGLGAAFARRVAKPDLKLILQYRESYNEVAQIAKECERKGAQAVLLHGNFSTSRGTEEFIEKLYPHNPFHAVFCHGPYLNQTLEEGLPSDVVQCFQENTFSVMQICQALLASLQNGQGRVLFVGVTSLQCGSLQAPAYAAAKSALQSYMYSLAKYLAPYKSTVNMFSPGFLANTTVEPGQKRIPMGSLGSVEEAADALHFLYSSPCYQTGNNIEFSGGYQL